MVEDITEPIPVEKVEGVENPTDEPWLWRVELYLVSKFQPEFYESTIFKLRAAAVDRAKVVKEHHIVLQGLSALEQEIRNDITSIQRSYPNQDHHNRNRPAARGRQRGLAEF